jgi:hypothetical protein
MKSNPFNNKFNCDCPMVVEIPSKNGLPAERLAYPERNHKIWHQVTFRDSMYFKLNPGKFQYLRDAVEGEGWPAELPAGTKVLVYKIDSGHQARCFQFPEDKAEVA